MLKALLFILFSFSVFGQEVISLKEETTIIFNQPVTEAYVSQKIKEAYDKSFNLEAGVPLYIVLNTPGGSIDAGLMFISTIQALGRPVHTITIFAASMGYQIVQSLNTRYVLPNGLLMAHRGSINGLSGQIPGEIYTRLKRAQSMIDIMTDVASKRIGISKKTYVKKIRDEYWVMGNSAVIEKSADKVTLASCSKEMIDQSYTSNIQTMFGELVVEFSKCPLIETPLSLAPGKNMKPDTDVKQLYFSILKSKVYE